MNIIDLAQIHIIVDDLDEASDFYRNVLGMIEMQSHENISNAGLAAYYGYSGNPEDFRVSLRFLFIPDVLTIKLVKVDIADYAGGKPPTSKASGRYANYAVGGQGRGPISLVVEDLDETYQELLKKARDYSDDSGIKLVSEPAFLSPLQPHEIGTTEHSVIHDRQDILDVFMKSWSFRAKFQMIDPFGVQWEFNNDVDGSPE